MGIDTLGIRALLAAGMAACVVAAIRWPGEKTGGAGRRMPLWALGVLLVGSVLGVALATPGVMLWGFHGQMHWAFSLATLRSGMPEDPVFAGQPLTYPWTAHWVYAHVGRALGVSPMVVLAGTDVLWLLIMVLAVGRAALIVTGKRGAAICAGFLAWTGALVTDDAYIALAGRIDGAIRPCMRMVPADKFFNPNNNPIGLAMGAVAVLCIVGIVVERRRAGRWAMVLFAACFVCAMMYPLSYVGILAMIAGAGAGLSIARRSLVRGDVLVCVAAAGIAGLLALPMMLAFDSGRGEHGRIVMTRLGEVPGKAAVLIAVGFASMVLIWAARHGRERESREERVGGEAWAMFLGSALALGGAYLAVEVPLSCEYKFLAQTSTPLACVLGPWVAGLARTRWWLAGGVLWVLSLGAADRMLVRFTLNPTVPIVVRDGHAHAINAETEELLEYVRGRTPLDSVFLAEERLLPTVGERSMYLEPLSLGVGPGDGWSMGRYKVALQVVGHSMEMLKQRESVQRRTLEPRTAAEVRDASGTLRAEFPTRAVFAIVIAEPEAAIVQQSGAWRLVRRFGAGWVFELSRSN